MKKWAAILAFLLPVWIAVEKAGFAVEQPTVYGPGWKELSDYNRSGLMQGNLIIIFTNIAGAPWPKGTLYKKLNVKPVEAAAIFYDYESHPEFLPDVDYGKIASGRGEAVTQIDYHMRLPWPYNGDNYTVENSLSKYGSSFEISWKVLRSSQVYEGVGSVRFEPLGTNETLMIYDNFTRPKNSMAGTVKSRANAALKNTVWAWINRIESQKSENPNYVEAKLVEFDPAFRKAPVNQRENQ